MTGLRSKGRLARNRLRRTREVLERIKA